jgi:hypothetical protein
MPTRLGQQVIDGSAASGAVQVTVPAGTTLVVAFWSHWHETTASTMSVLALGGEDLDVIIESSARIPTGDHSGVGIAALENPPSGSQQLEWAWSGGGARTEGGEIVLIYFSGTHPETPVRAGAAIMTGTFANDVSVDIPSEQGDTILAFGQRFSTGLLSVQVAGVTVTPFLEDVVNSHSFQLVEAPASSGSTTTVSLTDEWFSSVAALALPAAPATGATASGSPALPGLALVATAAAIMQASAALAAPALAIAGTASAHVQATATTALPAPAVAGAAQARAAATGALVLPALSASGSSASVPSSAAEGTLAFPALATSGRATAAATASGSLELRALAASGNAAARVAATGILALAGLDTGGAAQAPVVAGGALALPALMVSGTAAQRLIGAIRLTVEVRPAVMSRAMLVRPAVGTEAAVTPGIGVGATARAAVEVDTVVSPGG